MSPYDALYSGPYYGPSDEQGRGPDRSPYIVGLKRGLSRWSGGDALAWRQFNATYNLALEHAVSVFKREHHIPTPGSVWGKPAHDALEAALRKRGTTTPREPALDRTAIVLMQDAWDLKHPGIRDRAKVQASLADYLRQMVFYKQIWHYLQQRPIGSMGIAPDRGGRDDCSALVIAAYWWARVHTDIHVPDPAGYGFAGYGNTVSIYDTNRSRKLDLGGLFEVGDAALFGPGASRHTIICRIGGNAATSVWASHGSEAGPYDCRLNYRRYIWGGNWGDLFAVVRPVLVP